MTTKWKPCRSKNNTRRRVHRTATEGSWQSGSRGRRLNRGHETYRWPACLLQAAGTEIRYGREKQNGSGQQYRDRANVESVTTRRPGIKICCARKRSRSRDPGGALPKQSGGRLHEERPRRPDRIKKKTEAKAA
jgi:hypothetical protein